LDEVFVRIRGKLHDLWRAVDQHCNVLDVLVESRRNTKAAKRFFCKLLKGLCYTPRNVVTDKLGSYEPLNVRSCRAWNIGRAGWRLYYVARGHQCCLGRLMRADVVASRQQLCLPGLRG
jgi:hypothetical protein